MNETKVRGLKILVVDSDYDFLQVLTQFLNKEGYEVIPAHDGEEGLNKALVESPDLVILEPMLSKIHGFTLCGMITGEFKKNIPVVIVSQHYTEENIKKEALRTHGASAYLVRPITKSELRAVIDDVLGSKQPEPDVNQAVEREHPDLMPGADNDGDQTKRPMDTETKIKHNPKEAKADNGPIHIEELLASEGIMLKKPKALKIKAPADKENGAMKKIGAILNTEISFNKIRERLHLAIENEEISSINYKERIIPGVTQSHLGQEGEKERCEDPAHQSIDLQSEVSNNGHKPGKKVKVDEVLDAIMDEFGLSGTSTKQPSKPSL